MIQADPLPETDPLPATSVVPHHEAGFLGKAIGPLGSDPI